MTQLFIKLCDNFFPISIFIYRPLSEGKVLKQKFDDIFAATRYDLNYYMLIYIYGSTVVHVELTHSLMPVMLAGM